MLGNFLCFCCHLLTFFISKLTFSKILSGTLSECQPVWIQIRTNVLFAMVHQQTTKVATIKESVPVIYNLTPPPQLPPLCHLWRCRDEWENYLFCFPAMPGKCGASTIMSTIPQGIYHCKELGNDHWMVPRVLSFLEHGCNI